MVHDESGGYVGYDEYKQLEEKLAQHDKDECMPRSAVEALMESKLPCGHPNDCGFSPDGKGIHIYCKWCQEIKALKASKELPAEATNSVDIRLNNPSREQLTVMIEQLTKMREAKPL